MTHTQQLLSLAGECLTPNYAASLIITRGVGSHVWDSDGRRYLDFAGGMGVNVLGHGHARVVEAITQQASRVCHTSNAYLHEGLITLGSRLSKLSFGGKVFLANSGTEAVEAALKLARRYFYDRGQQRFEFIAAQRAFHGRTLGAMSVTGVDEYRRGFDPIMPGVHFVPYGDLDAIERCIGEQTAAVIVEPIMGNGGVILPPDGYLAALRQACDRAGCLLIFDEVQTGIGRTGNWFAYQHEGIVPDIMTLAKAVGGGLPLGAVAFSEAVASALQPGVHASTFGGNPVACAAGLATLDVIEDEALLERAQRLSRVYQDALNLLKDKRSDIVAVRGRGMLVGIQINKALKEVQKACVHHGLLVTAAGKDVLRLFPPLNAQESELEESIECIRLALDDVAWL